MKRTLLYLTLAAGLMGCAKEVIPATDEAPAGKPMTFEISVAGTKTQKTEWAASDVIYVFFNGLGGKYLTLTNDDGSWTNTPVGNPTEEDFAGLTTQTLTAVHFPVPMDVAYDEDAEIFFFTDPATSKPVYNFYLCEEDKEYTVEGTTVRGTLSMALAPELTLFYVAGAGDATFASPQVAPVACSGVGKDGSVVEEVLQAGARVDGLEDDEGTVYSGRLTAATRAVAIPKYTIILATDTKIFTFDLYEKTLEAGKKYNIPPTGRWSEQRASALYVDLGLSVMWARCNLGASQSTSFGNHYAWGEVRPKSEYTWDNYFFCINGNNEDLTKYTGSDYDTLQPEDDAAYAAFGGYFRLPTSEEIYELLTLEKEWVDDYESSGVSGYLFHGKGDCAGNSLFFPAAGYSADDDVDDTNSYGLYWSSSLYPDYPDKASNLYFDIYSPIDQDSSWRRGGFSIRPVYAE